MWRNIILNTKILIIILILFNLLRFFYLIILENYIIIICDIDITLDELMKIFSIRIGRIDLIGRVQMEFVFLYNTTKYNGK